MAETGRQKGPNRLAGPEGYKDKTILVTGGTGFLGQVLVEKILRSIPNVKRIYLLIRSKKDKNPQDRIKEMFKGPLYDLLKQRRGEEIFKKVTAIAGDVQELGLGLSKESRRLLSEEVEIIFHMAATVRFDDPLKKAVLLNTRGTKLMLDLAKECKKLLVFAHVSTAYSNPQEKVLYEKAYPPPADPHTVIRTVERLDENVLDSITSTIVGNTPNNYTFTKALGEALVNDEMDNLPVIILRPSVVVPIWLEPLPGWAANVNGPIGLLIGAGKGVVRTMLCDPEMYANFISADIAVNAFVVSTFDFMHYKKRRFYNTTTDAQELQFTWNYVVELGKKIVATRMPLNWVIWYPGGSMTKSRLYHNTRVVLFHYIPALFLDFILIVSGNKPILWKIQQRITNGFKLFEYYANNQWNFNNDGSLKARSLLTDTEKEMFKMDGDGFDIEEYFYNAAHAARLYILKEPDDTIPTARRHMKFMWTVDKVAKGVFRVWLVYLLMHYIVFPIMGMHEGLPLKTLPLPDNITLQNSTRG